VKPSFEQLTALLATKRIDCPDDTYWGDFLCEFHQRQRDQLVAERPLAGVWRRMTATVADLGSAKWAYGLGLAYAAVTVAFFVVPSKVEIEAARPQPVNHEVISAPAPAPAKGQQQPRPAGDVPAVRTHTGGQAF
jgi:hypothetical protein